MKLVAISILKKKRKNKQRELSFVVEFTRDLEHLVSCISVEKKRNTTSSNLYREKGYHNIIIINNNLVGNLKSVAWQQI